MRLPEFDCAIVFICAHSSCRWLCAPSAFFTFPSCLLLSTTRGTRRGRGATTCPQHWRRRLRTSLRAGRESSPRFTGPRIRRSRTWQRGAPRKPRPVCAARASTSPRRCSSAASAAPQEYIRRPWRQFWPTRRGGGIAFPRPKVPWWPHPLLLVAASR